jgi:hypothetical protein
MASEKPYGHSANVVCWAWIDGPDGDVRREVLRSIHRSGSRARIERAARLLRGFIRVEAVFEYTRDEWVRAFGVGSERGKYRRRI